MKVTDSRLSMIADINNIKNDEVYLKVNNRVTSKKLLVPGRKHSEQNQDEKVGPFKKISTNSIMSSSTQSSVGSRRTLQEKSVSCGITQRTSDEFRRPTKSVNYTQIMH